MAFLTKILKYGAVALGGALAVASGPTFVRSVDKEFFSEVKSDLKGKEKREFAEEFKLKNKSSYKPIRGSNGRF